MDGKVMLKLILLVYMYTGVQLATDALRSRANFARNKTR